ncbi:MAG: MFS transporter [Pseudomonadota bacterium]
MSSDSAAADAAEASATRTPGLRVTATLLLVSSLTVLANATIAAALPGLARAFAEVPGIETLAGLVLSLPSLAVVLTAALFGLAADRVDRRHLLCLSLLAYALGGASGLAAQTMPQILAGRLLLGVGVAGTLTVATQMAADLWHGADRARFMGWQGAAISAAGIASVAGGGALAELGWRAPFALYLVALPVAVLALAVLPGPAGRRCARTRRRLWRAPSPGGSSC